MIAIILIAVDAALPVSISKKQIVLLMSTLITIFIVLLLLFQKHMYPNYITGFSIIFILLVPIFIFRYKNKGNILYITVLSIGLVFAIVSSIQWIAGVDVTVEQHLYLLDLFTNFFLLLICIVTYKKGILTRIFESISLLQRHMKAMLIITVWICALIAMVFSYITSVYENLPGFTILGTSLAIFIILVGIMCPLLILSSISKVHFKNLFDAMEKQVQAQVAHYETIVKMNEDMQKFQHDYNNLRLGLDSYLKRRDITGALNYLNSDEMSLSKNKYTYETGSLILDALLNEKQLVAIADNTFITFDGVLPDNLLSTAEICIVFGNALDNAIEACTKLPKTTKKEIAIKSTYSHNFLFIKITNTVEKDVVISKNHVVTTKENKQTHGIGLRSIRTVIEKNSGTLELSCNKNIFCLEIDLDFNQTTKKDKTI